MNKDIKLGMKIQELKNYYSFNTIVAFLKGEKSDCFAFTDLKPLYDEFGYKEVNDLIIEVADGEAKNEQC